MLGLHPHADSTLRGPEAATLAEHQLSALLDTIGCLQHGNRETEGNQHEAPLTGIAE